MSTTTKLERDLVTLCRRIDDLTRLNDQKVHLFMRLREQNVTQARIGELAGISDVGVIQAIKRHHKRHGQAVIDRDRARDEKERSSAEAEMCAICAASEEPEPIAVDA